MHPQEVESDRILPVAKALYQRSLAITFILYSKFVELGDVAAPSFQVLIQQAKELDKYVVTLSSAHGRCSVPFAPNSILVSVQRCLRAVVDALKARKTWFHWQAFPEKEIRNQNKRLVSFHNQFDVCRNLLGPCLFLLTSLHARLACQSTMPLSKHTRLNIDAN